MTVYRRGDITPAEMIDAGLDTDRVVSFPAEQRIYTATGGEEISWWPEVTETGDDTDGWGYAERTGADDYLRRDWVRTKREMLAKLADFARTYDS